jgi:hypothetical protein
MSFVMPNIAHQSISFQDHGINKVRITTDTQVTGIYQGSQFLNLSHESKITYA